MRQIRYGGFDKQNTPKCDVQVFCFFVAYTEDVLEALEEEDDEESDSDEDDE